MVRGIRSEKEQFLLNLSRIQERARRAQEQITSGYTINRPSDEPASVVRLMGLFAQLGRAEQIQTNLERVSSDVNSNEAAIRNAVKILEDINVIGVQGATATATPDGRSALAERVRSLHSELVRIANTNHNGRFQFAGDLDAAAPYTADWSQPSGVVRNHTAADTRVIESISGEYFGVSRRAQDIFDLRDSTDAVAPGNVFHAVYELASGLETNDVDRISAAVGLIKGASEHLNSELMFYGSTQNRLTEAIDQAKKTGLRLTTEIAELRETDAPAAILELQQAQTALEIAMSAQGSSSRRTLFDYLG
jgi:flagellar hook-associated protein 3 FlgL